MTNLWPILTLLPPLTVTVFGGRSAWLWLYLIASIALMFGLVKYVIYQFGQGNTDPLFKTLLLSNSADHRAAAVDRGPSAPCRDRYCVVLGRRRVCTNCALWRCYVDYDEVQHVYLVSQIASLITIILAIIAALRPLRSWWIKRRAS